MRATRLPDFGELKVKCSISLDIATFSSRLGGPFDTAYISEVRLCPVTAKFPPCQAPRSANLI